MPPATLLAAFVCFAVSALAAVAPGVSVVVAVIGVVGLRAVDRVLSAFWRRRYERGPRRTDHAVAIVASPWALASAVLLSLPTLILPTLMGVSAAFLVGLVSFDSKPIGPDSALALGCGMAVALLTAWRAPGGFTIRRAFAEVVKVAAPTERARQIVIAVLGLIGVSAVIVATQGVRDETFIDLLRAWVPGF